jgi:hypothetical protein
MDERPSGGLGSGLCDVPGPIDMEWLHLGAEGADEVDDRSRAPDGVANAGGVADVGFLEAELPDLPQWLKEIIVARVAGCDPDPDAAPEQIFADISADETGAAEDSDKLLISLDHGLAR